MDLPVLDWKESKMKWYEILMVSIGLSLDVFAYAMYKGAMVSRVDGKKVSKMTAIFATWQIGAMLVGSLIAEIPVISRHLLVAESLYVVLAALIFFAVGVIMLVKATEKGKKIVLEHRADEFPMKQLCAWAAITSIDSLMAGVSFGFMNAALPVFILQLICVTIVVVIAGIWIGYRLGCRMRVNAVRIGGCILLVAGVEVLARYFAW